MCCATVCDQKSVAYRIRTRRCYSIAFLWCFPLHVSSKLVDEKAKLCDCFVLFSRATNFIWECQETAWSLYFKNSCWQKYCTSAKMLLDVKWVESCQHATLASQVCTHKSERKKIFQIAVLPQTVKQSLGKVCDGNSDPPSAPPLPHPPTF